MRVLLAIGELSVKMVDVCGKIMYCVYRMPIDKYTDVTK